MNQPPKSDEEITPVRPEETDRMDDDIMALLFRAGILGSQDQPTAILRDYLQKMRERHRATTVQEFLAVAQRDRFALFGSRKFDAAGVENLLKRHGLSMKDMESYLVRRLGLSQDLARQILSTPEGREVAAIVIHFVRQYQADLARFAGFKTPIFDDTAKLDKFFSLVKKMKIDLKGKTVSDILSEVSQLRGFTDSELELLREGLARLLIQVENQKKYSAILQESYEQVYSVVKAVSDLVKQAETMHRLEEAFARSGAHIICGCR